MKLQTKINIRFLIITFLVFAVAGAIFYFALNNFIDRSLDSNLKLRKEFVKSYLNQHNFSDSIYESPDYSISIKRLGSHEKFKKYTDTLIYDKDEKELIHCRKITVTTQVRGVYYKVSVIQSLVETEDLVAVIFTFMIILFGSILLALFFLNRWLSKSTWRPFFSTLTKLKTFKIGKTSDVSFEQTNIYEFEQLNEALNGMIQKIQTDFTNLKEFTENASHEIQTPLAIIKSKLELVLQDKSLNENQHKQMHIAYESAIRLSKLNETLLLLSKIENRQFTEQIDIDLCDLIKSRIDYLEELLALKQIHVTLDLDIPVIVSMNPMLADILINNLLNNALKHNVENGVISVSAQNRQITIANTGVPVVIDPRKIFQRFVKQGNSKDSTGLGLAIANEICKIFKLSLQYKYQNDLHYILLEC